MPEQAGIFIVLEGADGSGKGTQFRLLTERLRAVGYEVEVFDFPRYHKTSSHFVRRYLNGDYGPAKDINPYTASLFYALDRFEAAPAIRKAIAQGKIVLSNRYVGSNMAHQGGKFKDPVQQRGFFVWEDGLEFQMLGIPRPNFNFFLKVPAEISYNLIAKKTKREYTNATHDEHEKDLNHLRNSIATYDTLCKLFPKDFQAIECVEGDQLLSVATINDKLWEKLKPMLPKKPQHDGRDVVVRLNEAVENPIKDNQVPSSSKPAPDSTTNQNTNTSLNLSIQKVSLLAYGAIQNTQSVKAKITNIEWSIEGKYGYYTQSKMPKKTVDIYKSSMEKLISLHKQMSESAVNNPKLLNKIRSTAPLATLVSTEIEGEPFQILRLINQLRVSPLEEVRWLAQQILAKVRKLYPNQFKAESLSINADVQKEAASDVIAKLVAEYLPQTLPANTEVVTLVETQPRNEFDLLIDSLYTYSTSTRNDIAAELENWTYDQKTNALEAALNQPDGQLLRQPKYLWNVICERSTFNQIRKTIKVDDLRVQPPTPRYGYEVSQIVEQAGIDELYMECFDESLKLFSSLQAAEFEDLASYATLLGHKNRWQFSTNAEALKNILKADISLEARELLSLMREKVAEVNPIIGDFISTQPSQVRKKEPLKHSVSSKRSSSKRRRDRKPKK